MSNALRAHIPATYDDLRAVPEPYVAEIIGGELIVSPRPSYRHGLGATVVAGSLMATYGLRRRGGGPGGWWILIEPEIHLGDDILVPDLAGWRRERMPALPEGVYTTLAPDWVCEVLSPSSQGRDRVEKMGAYGQAEVQWYWLVDPLARVLEVYHLSRVIG